MKYLLHRVNTRIMQKLFLYLFLIIEISLGSALLFYSYSQYIKDKKEYDQTNKYIENSTTAILSNPSTTDKLSYDDYIYLKENIFKNTDAFYTVNATLKFNYGLKKDSSIALMFMTPEEMKNTFGIDAEDDKTYIGEIARKHVKNISNLKKSRKQINFIDGVVTFGLEPGHYIELTDMDIDFTKTSIKFLNKELEFVDMPENTKEKVIITNPIIQDMTTKETKNALMPNQPKGKFMIIVPAIYSSEIDKIVRPWNNDTMFSNIKPRIVINNFEKAPEEIWSAIDYLKSKHKDVNYTINDPRATNQNWIEYKRQSMAKYLITSMILLLVVSIINSGIFLLLHQSRKKEIAISIACGSTIKNQIKELVLEISSLIIYGMILGIATSYLYGDIAEHRFFAKNNAYRGLNITTNIEPFILLGITAIIILIISSYVTIKATKKLNPIEILQNE